MEPAELKRVVEALIFAADAPLTPERIRETLPEELNGFDLDQIVDDLNRDYAGSDRAFFIRHVAGGYQVTTRPELHTWIRKLFLGRNKMRLSQAALEALAIIAFKQPISRVDVAQIRGVNSDGVIGTLLEKKLITISGRSEGVGRPLLYNTTPEFLQYFGVNDLADLPKPREIEELIGREGMPEEVLQALSDEKQLELPIELSAETPADLEPSAPALAMSGSAGGQPEAAAANTVAEEKPPAEESGGMQEFVENGETSAPPESVETKESMEAEVDAILVEDLDATESQDPEEESDSSGEHNGSTQHSAAPEQRENFFLQDARMAMTPEEPVLPRSPATDHERVAALPEAEAARAQHPPRERKKRVRPQKIQAQEPDAVIDIHDIARAPAVRVVDLEPHEIHPPVPIAVEQTEMMTAEAPELVRAPAAEKDIASEAPLFFVPAPSENGAQQESDERKSESSVLNFFKMAVGWIKNAWQKLVGK